MTQLVAKLSDKEYMGFGLSGNPERSQMVGGDVTVAWMDHITGEYINAFSLGQVLRIFLWMFRKIIAKN